MGALTRGESADLFDLETGQWVGVTNRAGQDQRVPTWSDSTGTALVDPQGVPKLVPGVDNGIAAPTSNLSAAVGAAGSLTGAYYYTQTFVTANGETAPWPGDATVVNPSSQRVNLTGIPVGPAGVIARRIYRTPASPVDIKDYRFVAEIADNTTTTYTDNLADGSLGSPVKWNAANRGTFKDASGATFAQFSDQSCGFGQGAFAANVGYASVAIGYNALNANTTGRRNAAIGTYALPSLTTGYENVAVGTHAGQSVLANNGNTLIGYGAGYYVGAGAASGTENVAVGRQALWGSTSGIGQRNIAIGAYALLNINTADNCIAIGTYAGQFANASRQLFIDNGSTLRANLAEQQDEGLIYGLGNTTASGQELRFNAMVRLGGGGAATAIVANLPAASAAYKGYRAWVSDATVTYTSANVGSTVAGGGSNTAPVFCNGTNWVIG